VNTSWWSEADAAELDVLLEAFVESALIHRARCSVCKRGPWCEQLRECFDGILAWRRRRQLITIAAALRARQDFADWAAA
jgi:hypothetical protein